jgi:apolipoprotein N-acyltransferase
MAVGAAVFGLIGLFFVFLTIAAALDTFLDTWLALLITTVLLFVIAGVLGLIGYGRIKKGTPPVPEQAIREAKLTQEALRR